jgi:hypothetical protein
LLVEPNEVRQQKRKERQKSPGKYGRRGKSQSHRKNPKNNRFATSAVEFAIPIINRDFKKIQGGQQACLAAGELQIGNFWLACERPR